MPANQTEAELRRIWGSDYETNLDAAVGVLDSLSQDNRERFMKQGGSKDFEALRLMGSEAYTNPKHPDHLRVSQTVREHTESMFGSQPPEIF
jgi:hypothetical protein